MKSVELSKEVCLVISEESTQNPEEVNLAPNVKSLLKLGIGNGEIRQEANLEAKPAGGNEIVI